MPNVIKVNPASGFSVISEKNHLPKLTRALAITLPIVTNIVKMLPNIPLIPPIIALIKKIRGFSVIYVLLYALEYASKPSRDASEYSRT